MRKIKTPRLRILNIKDLKLLSQMSDASDYTASFPLEIHNMELEFSNIKTLTTKELITLGKISKRVKESFGISNINLNNKQLSCIFSM